MSLFKPWYVDKASGERKQSAVWWFKFRFAGKTIRESAKTPKRTLAAAAMRQRREELERGFNAIPESRAARIQTIASLADTFLEGYKLRHPRSSTFAAHAIGHLKRLLGSKMRVDITADLVKGYQTARLKEGAGPKSINDEVLFLLRLGEEQGDIARAKLRRERTLKLKVRSQVAKAYDGEEQAALLAAARNRRLPCMYTALMLGFNAGLREGEILGLQWGRVDLKRQLVVVGHSKTAAGTGRVIPLNTDLLAALTEHARWFEGKFGARREEWFVFPYGKPQPTDPARPMTTLKTAWSAVRKEAKVSGRFHDTRHSFITALAESGEAGDETIRSLAGHVSKQMLSHYSHIGMEAKKRAVAALRMGRAAKVVNIAAGVGKVLGKVGEF